MDKGQALAYLHPSANPPADYYLDGQTGQIAHWESKLGPRPTDQQLKDAWIPALKAQKKSEIRARVVSECEALMPVYEMLYCVRARVVDPRLATLDAIAAKGRVLEARANAAATEADLLAVVW